MMEFAVEFFALISAVLTTATLAMPFLKNDISPMVKLLICEGAK